MEQIARIFSIAMPIFLALILSEKLIGYLKGNDTVPWMDALSSSYSGITLAVRALFGLGISIVSYEFMYQHLAVVHIETTWLVYVVTFVVLDFEFYWGHRLHHEINFLWYGHLIHHNSEEYNLATSMRQPFIGFINYLFFLSLPAALLGLSPTVIAIVLPIHKFSQVWYHTRQIGKLGFLEYIIVTPSQHRVHHALNPIYLDKNHSAIFNIWDRLFGTFQDELDSEPPVYGITRPSRTYNPVTINFEHLILLIKDAWRAEKWIDKLTIWFRPTGWRPEGFEEKYPVAKITDHYNFEKFNPPASRGLLYWSMIQFFTLFFVVVFAFHHISLNGMNVVFALALFVLVQTYSATELMNRNKWAPVYSLISTMVCIALYVNDTTWFGINSLSSLIPSIFLSYFVLQTIMAFVFSKEPSMPTEKSSYRLPSLPIIQSNHETAIQSITRPQSADYSRPHLSRV
ncbi:MAG: sterol desaturase family protein [Bacteroidetes bacterium]|nr:sterol desaturase family protein [Bacteroidota bacterium]